MVHDHLSAAALSGGGGERAWQQRRIVHVTRTTYVLARERGQCAYSPPQTTTTWAGAGGFKTYQAIGGGDETFSLFDMSFNVHALE